MCQNAIEMKSGSWRNDRKYDRARPETSITSWAVSIVVFGSIIWFAVSPASEADHSPRQTCTVIVDCLKAPLILHTNSFLHRAFIVTLKSELKFIGHLLHRIASAEDKDSPSRLDGCYANR